MVDFIIDHKQGDTISWEAEYRDDLGSIVDITNYIIKCQARDKNDTSKLLFSLTSEGPEPTIDVYDPANGLYRFVIDTNTFPIGRYLVDIEYTIGTLIKSSATFELNIYESITR